MVHSSSVNILFPFQTNITFQMWPSGGNGLRKVQVFQLASLSNITTSFHCKVYVTKSISKYDDRLECLIMTKSLHRHCKGKGLDTCYSATYMSQTRDQQRFTISEVATDWHEPIVLQRIMWPSIARANVQLDPRCS